MKSIFSTQTIASACTGGKAVLLFILTGFTTHVMAQNYNLDWIRQNAGNGMDYSNESLMDNSGNFYVSGHFSGTTDLDPGAGTLSFTSAGLYDLFVQKLDANGNLLWAKRVGGSGYEYSGSMAVDASGNVYFTGLFSSTVDFDPGAGVFNLSSNGTYNIFILKLDANGNFVWAKRYGNNVGYNYCYGIALDASDNIYSVGKFAGTMDFDPGTATNNLTAAGGNDGYLQKLDANGNFVWAKKIGGSQSDWFTGIRIAPTGNIYLIGDFQQTADLDPGAATANFTAAGTYDAFILKLDASANYLWAKQQGGTNRLTPNELTIDVSENLYIAYDIDGTADFDPSASSYILTYSGGAYDGAIAKMDSNGDFVWAGALAGSGYALPISIAVDGSGNVYSTGFLNGTNDFDPGAGIQNLTTGTYNSIFLLKWDANGNFDWVKKYGSPTATDENEGRCLFFDNSGKLYVSGFFSDSFDFDLGAGNTTLNSAGASDGFFMKMSCQATATDVQTSCGPYTWINGVEYTTSNSTATYSVPGGAVNGCDSIVTLNLTIGDATAPVPDLANLSDINATCSVSSLVAPTATDNCTGTITGTHNVILPIATQGTTVITWTYDDGNGNTVTQTQNVIIDDNTAPVPTLANLSDVTGQCSVTTLTAPTANDNCAGTITGTHNAILPITTPGTTVVTWTFNDGNGNTVTQTQNVIIDDNTAPVPTLANLSDVTGQCSVTTLTAPTANDNCAGTITGTHNASLPITTQGTTVVTWTFNDGHGNTFTQTQNVIIDDVTAPVPNLANLPDISAGCAVNALTAPTATDNCAGTITATHNATLPITAAGTTIVTWTYDDGQGNTASQTQNVIITPINASASISGITLTASPAGALYQWIDCGTNTPVSGATAQSFTPLVNGSYAVTIMLNGCTETSSCVAVTTVGIETLNPENWKVYPNPAGEKLHIVISGEETIAITDVSGKIIGTEQLLAGDNVIDVSAFAPGVYFIQSVAGKSTVKFVKE